MKPPTAQMPGRYRPFYDYSATIKLLCGQLTVDELSAKPFGYLSRNKKRSNATCYQNQDIL
jgi:hypothetical protein